MLYTDTKDFTIWNKEDDMQFPDVEKEGYENIIVNDSYLF